jgi:hypothetical protein
MAKINENPLVRGAQGNFGKQFVYRNRGNDTFITRMPRKKKGLIATQKQEEVRDLFAAASLYAQGAVTDPDLKKEYEKKAPPGRTAYNIAFRDYLKAPEVKGIETQTYNGSPGSTIVISAKDDFRVVEVAVSIHTAGGVLIEEGKAILNPVIRNKWIYTVKQTNASMAGSKIKAVALDLPGNSGVLEITI